MAINQAPTRRTSVGHVLAATFFWGATSAAFATLGSPPLATGAIAAISAGVILLVVARAIGHPVLSEFKRRRGVYLRLGMLESVNLVLYVYALQLGQLPVVAALHLTAPVMLVLWEISKSRSRFDLHIVLEILLVAGAVVLVSISAKPDGDASRPILGAMLALGSAVAVAALIAEVVNHAPTAPAFTGPGLQLVVAGALLAPFILLAPPTTNESLVLVLIGCLVFSAGFAFYWIGLRGTGATLAGILGLSEAVFATAIGAFWGSTSLNAVTAVAAVFVLLATAVELRRAQRHGVVRPAGF